MSEQKTVKAQARAVLRHNYAAAVIALITLLLPIFVIDGAVSAADYLLIELLEDSTLQFILSVVSTVILTIVIGLLLSPLFNGYIRLYYRAGYTEDFDMADLFYYFKKGRYARSVSLNLSFMLRMALPLVICYLPLIIYDVMCYLKASDFVDSTLYLDFRFILCVLSGVLVILYSLRYFAVFTLYVENDRLSNRDIVRYSKQVMRGHSVHALRLYLSYLPWILLCITVLPMLYVIPYLTQGLCIGAKWMTQATFERN